MTKTADLALAMFFLGVAVLAATATSEDPALPRLARLRVVTAVGAVVAIALSSDFALGAACGGLLLAVLAIWLDRLRAARERTWREQFELPFAEYVRRAGS